MAGTPQIEPKVPSFNEPPDAGFAPEAWTGQMGRKRRVELRACPFREVATEHQAVVC